MPLLVINERLSGDLALLAKLPSREYVASFCAQSLEALGVGAKKAALKSAAAALGVELEALSGSIMALSLLFVEAAKVRCAALRARARVLARRRLTPPAPPPRPAQRNLSAMDLSLSMGDVALPEDSKREVADFYGAHLGELREGLGLGGGGGAGGGGGGAEEGAGAAAAAAAPGALAALGLAVAREELLGGAGALLPASGASAVLPEYRGLEWRLEVEVARRALHEALAPNFVLQLAVAGVGPEGAGAAARGAGDGSGGSGAGAGSGAGTDAAAQLAAAGPRTVVFDADFQALKRAAASLSTAGLERSMAHVKRVYKTF
jgi:hypothetical protein